MGKDACVPVRMSCGVRSTGTIGSQGSYANYLKGRLLRKLNKRRANPFESPIRLQGQVDNTPRHHDNEMFRLFRADSGGSNAEGWEILRG